MHRGKRIRLMFQDEAGFGRINKPKYCWCEKGVRPSVPCHHMIRDAVCQRKMKLENPQKTLKLRLILDKFSAELFVNGGCQTFSTTFYTPLEADDIVFKCNGKAILNIEKFDIQTEQENE